LTLDLRFSMSAWTSYTSCSPTTNPGLLLTSTPASHGSKARWQRATYEVENRQRGTRRAVAEVKTEFAYINLAGRELKPKQRNLLLTYARCSGASIDLHSTPPALRRPDALRSQVGLGLVEVASD
jgi:hypothetical protein